MKVYRYILLLLSVILLMSGCVAGLAPDSEDQQTGEKVTFTFSPSFVSSDSPSVQTKAFGNKPNGGIKNIYFAVFDAAGYKLSEYEKAELDEEAVENGKPYQYSVSLVKTNKPRIVHIIANAPESLKYGSETEVIGSLTTSYFADGESEWQDAYWGRLVLEKGVPDPEDDPTSYNAVKALLGQAVLVRNFARINVRVASDVKNFVLHKFWLTNFPDKGSIAPYNRNTQLFQNNYKEYTNIEALSGEGNYHGFCPAKAELVDLGELIAADNGMTEDNLAFSPEEYAYCYEREMPESNPLYVVVAGYFNGESALSYYKIDLLNHNDEYFPLLRNFTYEVNIRKVEHAGRPTLAGALSAAPSGNVDASLDMKHLTNISDGKAQIFVSQTDAILVNGSTDTHVMLKYKFVPDITNPSATSNGTTQTDGPYSSYVSLKYQSLDPSLSSVFKTDSEGNLIVQDQGDDPVDGYRCVLLTLNDISDDISRTDKVTVIGHYFVDGVENKVEKQISREVTYRRRDHFNFELGLEPQKILKAAGQSMNLVLKLEDGLPSSIFSLGFTIEAANLTISAPLPINVGGSTIPGHSFGANPRPSYSFTKTILWDEYQSGTLVNGMREIRVPLSTSTSDIPQFSSHDAALCADVAGFVDSKYGDVIYVSNKFFDAATTYYYTFAQLRNFGTISVSPTSPATDIRVGEDCTLTFSLQTASFQAGSDFNRIVRIGMKGFEPAAAEKANLTLIGKDAEGYEIYEMTNVTQNCSLQIVPFEAGDGAGSIKLMADEYNTASAGPYTILPGAISVYIDETGTTSQRSVVQSGDLAVADANGYRYLVEGQKATLTVYITEPSRADVKIGGLTATNSAGTVQIDGVDYYRYSTASAAYTAPSGSAQAIQLAVTVNEKTLGKLRVLVCKINLGSALTSASFNTGNYYVIKNNSTGNYLYDSGSNGATAILRSSINYDSLVKFSSAGSPSTIKIGGNGRYLSYTSTTSTNVTLNTTQSSWYFNYNSNYFRIRKTNNNTSYYLYDNNSAIASANQNKPTANQYQWMIYPVTFTKPTLN